MAEDGVVLVIPLQLSTANTNIHKRIAVNGEWKGANRCKEVSETHCFIADDSGTHQRRQNGKILSDDGHRTQEAEIPIENEEYGHGRHSRSLPEVLDFGAKRQAIVVV